MTRWIIYEKTGRWATALRSCLGVGAPRLHEMRSLIDCRQELARWPFSLLMLEATPANLEGVFRLLDELHGHYPRARGVVLASRELAVWEDILREAGAVHVALTPRRLDLVVALAERHFAGLPAKRLGVRERIWSRLPWGSE